MIHLSAAALREVLRLQRKQLHSNAVLRLGVEPGGCSDYHYTLQFDKAPQPEDWVKDYQGIQVAIDAQSLRHLDGLTLDYSEDLMGGAFRFDNPSATHHCGCGSSFSVATDR